MQLTNETILHASRLEAIRQGDVTILLDPAGPNWAGADEAGRAILEQFDGRRTLGDIIRAYAAKTSYEPAKAWHHVNTIARDALRQGLLSPEPVVRSPYAGRAAHLTRRALTELWLHTNNSCNLACRHCLVSSGPDGDKGLPTEKFLEVIAQ
ncbi:MAG: PqqD family peptide modification chaperone, partial [Nitrospirota bacterium]